MVTTATTACRKPVIRLTTQAQRACARDAWIADATLSPGSFHHMVSQRHCMETEITSIANGNKTPNAREYSARLRFPPWVHNLKSL